MSVKAKSLLILVVLAAVSCCLLVFKLVTEQQLSASVSNELSLPKTGHKKEIKAKKQETNLADISPSKSSLAQEFSTSKNLRAFIESARRRPKEGGYRYINSVLIQCEALGKSVPKYDVNEDSRILTKKIDVANFWVTRCQGLLESDVGHDKNSQLTVEGKNKKDSFYELQSEISDPTVRTNRTAWREKVRRWLAIKDPIS